MSNPAYEKLHKLVKYLLQNGQGADTIAKAMGVSLKDFYEEFVQK